MSAPVRSERFEPVGGGTPELELVVGAGSVRVVLDDDATDVAVTLTAGRAGGWQQRLGGVLAALGQVGTHAAGTADGDGVDPAADVPDPAGVEALDATEVAWSAHRHRLVVRTPQSGPSRSVPVEVAVTAPTGSALKVRASSAGVVVTGRAGDVDVSTGSGSVDLGRVGGRAEVRTGSGSVRAGRLDGRARVRTGSGDVVVDAVAAPTETVTGSGTVRVGLGRGVLVELDVRTGSGAARCDLPVLDTRPESGSEPVALRVRTGSGDVTVHGARD